MKKFHYLNFVLKYFTPPITNVRFELIMRSFPWLNCLCQIVKDMAWAMNLLLMWGYISFDDDNGRKLFFHTSENHLEDSNLVIFCYLLLIFQKTFLVLYLFILPAKLLQVLLIKFSWMILSGCVQAFKTSFFTPKNFCTHSQLIFMKKNTSKNYSCSSAQKSTVR